MGLLALCVTALLFGAVLGEGPNSFARLAPEQQPKSLLELLKKDARELAELVKYHDNKLNTEGGNTGQPGGIKKTKRYVDDDGVYGMPNDECRDTRNDGFYGPLTLCRECSYMRYMPIGYWPDFLNEWVCERGQCLKGGGRCLQQYSEVQVHNQDGQLVTRVIRSGCKCAYYGTNFIP